MKAKSQKLRTLLVLKSLYKHSDKKHHTNLTKINAILRSYGLEYRDKTLKDTVNAMRIAGIDVCQSSPNSTASVWIENRPLDDGRLEKLVFAVATNPFLSSEQITEILRYLTPFVTEYQEEQLVGTATNMAQAAVTDDYINAYTVISHAIRAQRRVSFVAPHHKYSHTNSIKSRDIRYRVSFTPKWILPFDGELYTVGYNNQTKYIEAFDLRDITEILSFPVYNQADGKRIEETLSRVDPTECVAKLRRKKGLSVHSMS